MGEETLDDVWKIEPRNGKRFAHMVVKGVAESWFDTRFEEKMAHEGMEGGNGDIYPHCHHSYHLKSVVIGINECHCNHHCHHLHY